METKKIACNLREARGSIPLHEVANAIGISTSALCNYETGRRIPRDDIKKRLAEYYKKGIEQLFFYSNCSQSKRNKRGAKWISKISEKYAAVSWWSAGTGYSCVQKIC